MDLRHWQKTDGKLLNNALTENRIVAKEACWGVKNPRFSIWPVLEGLDYSRSA